MTIISKSKSMPLSIGITGKYNVFSHASLKANLRIQLLQILLLTHTFQTSPMTFKTRLYLGQKINCTGKPGTKSLQ